MTTHSEYIVCRTFRPASRQTNVETKLCPANRRRMDYNMHIYTHIYTTNHIKLVLVVELIDVRVRGRA